MDEKERKRFFNSSARVKILRGLKSKYREFLNKKNAPPAKSAYYQDFKREL